jgi:DNA-binding XRE family transcriptional regulator
LTAEIVMTSGRKSFGALVRREREAKEIGLREMAKKIAVSPTYLSKIERGDFDPPAEDKVRRIAEIIGRDPDELLALAGRVASDLTDIIRERPREMADFLRAAKGLTAEDMARFAAGNEGESKVGTGSRAHLTMQMTIERDEPSLPYIRR